jgi:hypothetical protein
VVEKLQRGVGLDGLWEKSVSFVKTATTTATSRGNRRRRIIRLIRITELHFVFLDSFEVREPEAWRFPRALRAIAKWCHPSGARIWDARQAKQLEDCLFTLRIIWEKEMTLESFVAGELSTVDLTRARTDPLNWEVSSSMFQAGARVVEGPKTVVYAAIQILLGIL